jgi:NAD(P)H-flavin reductase
MLPQDAVVTATRTETADTTTLVMRLQDENALLSYQPGQFNMIGLAGFGEAALTFSSDCNGAQFSHTIRAVGRVTNGLARLAEGDLVQVRGPFGRGWPLQEARGHSVLVVAGGSGVVPMRSFLERVRNDRGVVGELTVLYGARSPGEMLFLEETAQWASQPDVEVKLTVDDAPKGARWDGRVGLVTELLDHPSGGAPADMAFVCGPELMMRFVVRDLLLRGMRPSEIFVSLERRMRCGIGHCGHCQIGPKYVCRDGPVFRYSELRGLADFLL